MTIKEIEKAFNQKMQDKEKRISTLTKKAADARSAIKSLEAKVEDAITREDLEAYSKFKKELSDKKDLIELCEKSIEKTQKTAFYSAEELRAMYDDIEKELSAETEKILAKQKPLAEQIFNLGKTAHDFTQAAENLKNDIANASNQDGAARFFTNVLQNKAVLLGLSTVNNAGFKNMLEPPLHY